MIRVKGNGIILPISLDSMTPQPSLSQYQRVTESRGHEAFDFFVMLTNDHLELSIMSDG